MARTFLAIQGDRRIRTGGNGGAAAPSVIGAPKNIHASSAARAALSVRLP